jgi:hypothetical protein
MRRTVPIALFVALFIVTVVSDFVGRYPTEAASRWDVREYRELRIDSPGELPGLRGPATGGALKLQQAAVIRPRLTPGERALLVAQYSIDAPTLDVKETRIVRFSDTVLMSRETVVKRAAGQWRSEFVLPIPRGAADGLYTLTVKVEPAASAVHAVAQEKSVVFAIDSTTPSAPAAGTSTPSSPSPAPTVGSPRPAATSPRPAPTAPPPVATPPPPVATPPAPLAAPPPPVAAPPPPVAAPPPPVAAPPPPVAAPQVTAAPRPTTESTDAIRIKLWTDKSRYRIGDNVTFYFETNRKGYVTLINAGTSGAVTILFPNRFSQGHEVNGKTVYSIPRSEDGYTMNVSGPPGIELVYALMTLEPLKFAETNFSQTRSVFRSVDSGTVTRDINAVVKQTANDKQAKAMLELEVVK